MLNTSIITNCLIKNVYSNVFIRYVINKAQTIFHPIINERVQVTNKSAIHVIKAKCLFNFQLASGLSFFFG